MQQPTCVGLRIRSTSDARIIFHAVSLGILHKISRRLDNDERRAISSGSVFVWEERGISAESSLGIERWTDSIRWGPSRARDGFLFYHEREPTPTGIEEVTSDVFSSVHRYHSYRWGNLIKQTYSVFVETPFGRKKWHIIAYFTRDTVDYLNTIVDDPQLATLSVPPGIYKSARRSRSQLTENLPHDPLHLTLPLRFSYDDDYYCNPILAPNSCDLAPLAYLKKLAPQSRHPVDEMAIMSFLAC